MKKQTFTVLLIFFSFSFALAQVRQYDQLISEELIAKDTAKAVLHLVDKLKSLDPSKSGALEIMGTNNQIYELLFKYSTKKTQLLAGANYLKKLLRINPEDYQGNEAFRANYVDTYANLIYKAGKVKEAIHWEKIAVDNAFEHQKAEFSANLEKMRNGIKTW